MRKIFESLILATLTQSCYAAPSAGAIARDMGLAVKGAAGIMHVIFILTGVGLITMSLIKYHNRRSNPEQNSLGAALALLIVGLALIALAFIPMPK